MGPSYLYIIMFFQVFLLFLFFLLLKYPNFSIGLLGVCLEYGSSCGQQYHFAFQDVLYEVAIYLVLVYITTFIFKTFVEYTFGIKL